MWNKKRTFEKTIEVKRRVSKKGGSTPFPLLLCLPNIDMGHAFEEVIKNNNNKMIPWTNS
jgi:tRNA U34 2-thiouridine synthase MnmA/TrmU